MKDELCRTLLDQIYLEKEVEKLKVELAGRGDFTPMAAFRVFDHKNWGQLNRQ